MLKAFFTFCRGGQIRTDDLLVPNEARYRATLHPEALKAVQRYTDIYSLQYFNFYFEFWLDPWFTSTDSQSLK